MGLSALLLVPWPSSPLLAISTSAQVEHLGQGSSATSMHLVVLDLKVLKELKVS
jgi:hypothetical protein